MRKTPCFAVIGGDNRQVYLTEFLHGEGFTIQSYGLPECGVAPSGNECENLASALDGADFIILPLPATRDGINIFSGKNTCIPISDLFGYACSGQIIFGGKLSGALAEEAKKHGIRLYDYYEREDLTTMNAIPTAEGAVKLAIESVPFTLHGSRCMVTGYGRISKLLTKLLSAFGADVTVAARSLRDISLAEAFGFKTVKTGEIEQVISHFDIIFNTVPARIIDERALKKLKDGSLIIDLASPPGGTDFEAAEETGANVIWALSLPGKTAPKSAAYIIGETILKMIEEVK